MPFNNLLLNCLIEGRSVKENKRTVVVEKPEKNEIILFFKIDDQSNKRCTLRKAITLSGGICDSIVFYSSEGQKKVCFVELKGADIESAIKQVVNTYKNLKGAIKYNLSQTIEWKACILHGGAAPRLIKKEYRETLKKIFGKNGFKLSSGPRLDIGSFLRQ